MAPRADITRRRLLAQGLALGCSAAASPFVTPVALAAAPWDARLVVIILRGGMDGLDVVRPVGDPGFAALRPDAAAADAPALAGPFALHPALAPLMQMWARGELAVAHAVSTPYRDRRSHFDGQDLLEAGAGFAPGTPRARDGWLNRMLQAVPGVEARTAFAVGREDLLLLSGDAPVANWAPETRLALSPQAEGLLSLLYEGDPLFHAAAAEAIDLTGAMAAAPPLAEMMGDGPEADAMAGMMAGPGGGATGHLALAEFTAQQLRGDSRIAAFSLNGWDTHRNQPAALPRALGRLAEVLRALELGLGPVWGRTAVLAMTEFGRTARLNGTGGTDHGTGGAMVMAGGALRGGRVHTAWPGLTEADLYDRRDLMPTEDVRAYAAATMQGLFGLDRAVLEGAVFPGLDMSAVGPVVL